MNQPSEVIRDILKLGLSPEIEKLAQHLASQIDLPVVFIVNSEREGNFARRHSPQNPNEFWINITPQTDSKEFERLVVGLLYRGIQERRRYPGLSPLESYYSTLSVKHKRIYCDFLSRLTSVATSLDAELFLRQYGIFTSPQVHHAMIDDRIKKLKEFQLIKKRNPHFRWYREIEVLNLVDYGNYYRRGKAYRDKLMPLLRQVNKNYVRIVHWVSSLITEAEKRYCSDAPDEMVDWLLGKFIKLFKLENMVMFGPCNTFMEKIQLPNDEYAMAYSLIPEDWDNQEILINCSRYANYFLSLVHQASNFKAPVAHIYLINSEDCNAYSNPGTKNEYILTFTTGLFHKIHCHVHDESFNPSSYDVAKLKYDRKTYLSKFFCYVIFFITAHEYAHVVNGDCNRAKNTVASEEDRRQMESRADCTARKLLNDCFLFQYRTKRSSIKPPDTAIHNPNVFSSWLDTLTTNEFYQFTRPLVELQLQDQLDTFILKDSIQFAYSYIRNANN